MFILKNTIDLQSFFKYIPRANISICASYLNGACDRKIYFSYLELFAIQQHVVKVECLYLTFVQQKSKSPDEASVKVKFEAAKRRFSGRISKRRKWCVFCCLIVFYCQISSCNCIKL